MGALGVASTVTADTPRTVPTTAWDEEPPRLSTRTNRPDAVQSADSGVARCSSRLCALTTVTEARSSEVPLSVYITADAPGKNSWPATRTVVAPTGIVTEGEANTVGAAGSHPRRGFDVPSSDG